MDPPGLEDAEDAGKHEGPEGEGAPGPELEVPASGDGALPGEEDPPGEAIQGNSDAGAEDPEAVLKRDLGVAQEELGRLQDQHLRLAADFENYRKRVNGELAGRWDRAQAELVSGLLEGLDDLQRVSQFTSEDASVETLVEGVDLVERKILKALTDAGLEVLDPLGEVFDPNTMEAMMRVPTEPDGEEGTVQQVLQKGYIFKDQLVRPARVSVYMDDE